MRVAHKLAHLKGTLSFFKSNLLLLQIEIGNFTNNCNLFNAQIFIWGKFLSVFLLLLQKLNKKERNR